MPISIIKALLKPISSLLLNGPRIILSECSGLKENAHVYGSQC